MNKQLKTVEFIFGDSNFTQSTINLLQDYFQVGWLFAKSSHIYYIHPELHIAACQPKSILKTQSPGYEFKQITIQTIKGYVNRLQKQEADLDRRDQQTTSRIQCTSSKVTIASGHLEDRTINFRRRSKAQIGKANLSF